MRYVGWQRCPVLRRPTTAMPMIPCVRNVRAMGGVYVPSDSFGGQSPEKKAAGILRTFFTFVAARVVLAQLEGSGRGALGAYDAQAASDLHHFLQNVPLKDGDEWMSQLMRRNTSLGLRLMEVRDNYCEEAFEWDQLQRVARKDMKNANTKLMRQFATASLAVSLAQPGESAEGINNSTNTSPAGGASTVLAAASTPSAALVADAASDSAVTLGRLSTSGGGGEAEATPAVTTSTREDGSGGGGGLAGSNGCPQPSEPAAASPSSSAADGTGAAVQQDGETATWPTNSPSPPPPLNAGSA